MTAVLTGTNSERSFNEALARVLRTKNPRWRHDLTAEQHRAVRGGGMPDLIVRNSRGAPVVVETEYLPARTVEQDAIQRLGRILAGSGAAIEQCVALRALEALREAPQAELDAAVAVAAYEYCLYSSGANDGEHVRWPSAGWISGGVDDPQAGQESRRPRQRRARIELPRPGPRQGAARRDAGDGDAAQPVAGRLMAGKSRPSAVKLRPGGRDRAGVTRTRRRQIVLGRHRDGRGTGCRLPSSRFLRQRRSRAARYVCSAAETPHFRPRSGRARSCNPRCRRA